MSYQDTERRHHRRFHIKGLKLHIRDSRLAGFLSKRTAEEYPCLNISEGGLYFITKKVFKPETRLLLDITTPFSRNYPLQVKARVVWFKRSGAFHVNMIGAVFPSLIKSKRTKLKRLLEKVGQDKEQIPKNVWVKIIKESLPLL